MINCIILDDEPLAIKVIENFIKKIDFLNCLGSYSNANDSIDIIKKGKVDLMFLDINMPFVDGISFLKSLENPPKTIITSAHSEYAIEGYDLDVVDYLLKPIPFMRFEKAVNKVLGQMKENIIKFPELDFVFVRVNKLNIRINYDDILVIESLKDYIKIVTKNKNFIVHTTLTSFTGSLPKSKFIRIHRSTTAAINKIDVIDGSIAYINRTPYKIGGIYREAFRNLLINF
ncbi:MAG: LytR/AlgR family response regulator transcription factor [Flavobacteriales bacterium]|jgi:two-component system LytT family response regulator|tara:strand:- start:4808 stop:5497 length:690 start_codon:yes stop_codon:yes gene_type:complete